jgi:tetraacyldisaccharide 4'-kinase
VGFQDSLYNLATDKTSGAIAAVVKFFLFLLSLIYGIVVSILIFSYSIKKTRLACRVISVGNITLGGTGKTVMVELIANYLRKRGHKIAVLSRGYKKPGLAAAKLLPGYETMGDEPFMMFEKLKDVPILVDPDRVRSAKTAVAEYAVAIQQWRIKKDLEIVMLDGVNPFGNRWLLPRGILRQPMYTLKYADVFVLTNSGGVDLSSTRKFLSRINSRVLILEAEHAASGIFRLSRKGELLAPDFLKGQAVALFCGLGNPDSFRDLARKSGLKEELFFKFPDHYRYYAEDLEKMFKESGQKNIQVLVTTEKDAVRIPKASRERFGENIFILAAELKFKDEEQGFFNRLLRIYSD